MTMQKNNMEKDTEKDELTETRVLERLTDMNDDASSSQDDDFFSKTMTLERLDAKKEEIKKQPKPKKEDDASAGKETFLFIRDLIVCFVIVMGITNFIIRPVQVKGDSMYPTLANNELGFSNIIGLHTGELERFDIAIIYVPEKNEYLVKRVIGLPGETVAYQDDQLYINGQPVEEDFLDQDYVSTYHGEFTTDIEPITLGNDEYYCLGDNRPHSSDSRYYGPFKKDNIKSKGIFVLMPFSKFGVVTW